MGRINGISGTATSVANDDYVPLDGATNGTRKILATRFTNFQPAQAGIIYASDYGAVGDDSTDNTTALQDALDAVPSEGAVVVLPAGRIRCSGTLYITKPYVTLQGVGPGTRSAAFDGPGTGYGSKLVFTAAVDGIRISPEQDAAATFRLGGITLRDFGIVGTAITNGCYGIRSELLSGNPGIFGPTDDLLIERVAVINYQTGIYGVNNDITKVLSCWPTECGNGIKMSGGFYPMIASSCIADNTGKGIEFVNVYGGSITGNIIVRNAGNSLDFSSTTYGISVNGNTVVNDTGNSGITGYDYLLSLGAGVARCPISGNLFAALTGSGFLIDAGATQNDFSGNHHDNFTPAYGSGVNWVDGWESNWTAPTLQNSWVDFGSTLEVAGYKKSKSGAVRVKGVVKSGTVGANVPVFTLPAGSRPANIQLFNTITNNGSADVLSRLVVNTSGQVVVETGSNTFAVLDCQFNAA